MQILSPYVTVWKHCDVLFNWYNKQDKGETIVWLGNWLCDMHPSVGYTTCTLVLVTLLAPFVSYITFHASHSWLHYMDPSVGYIILHAP